MDNEDEDDDEKYSSGEEGDGEAGEEQDAPVAKRTMKSRKASKAKEKVHGGLTRINAENELEWLAKLNGEGGKIHSIGPICSNLISRSTSCPA